MITFDDFRHEWETHRVGDDSLVFSHEETNQTKYQCVSLIKQYIRECFGLEAGAWGNAIDYWSRTNPALLTKFSKDGSGNVQKGDIVVLRTHGYADYTEPGHIGIATGNGDPNSVEILEQNGMGSGTGLGQDAIRTRFIPRNRIAGVLRPISVAHPAPVEKYHVTETYPQGRQIKLNKQPTNLWGMNYANPGALAPIEVHNAGEIWTVTNKVHHINGYDYYRRDGQVDGFNILDCDDYTPPPPPPYVPPAAPAKAEPAETYDVITKLMVFPSAVDAKSLSNYTGTDLEPGKYFVFDKVDNAYNLSTDNVKNQNRWVRITDNKVSKPVEPESSNIPVPAVSNLPTDAPATDIDLPTDPAPVIADVLPTPDKPKPQYNWIRQDMLPVRLTSTNSTAIKISDLEGKWPTQDFPAHHTEDYSMFAVVNGIEYWLPDKTRKKGYMYGLSVAFLPDEEPIKPTVLDRNANGKYDIVDIFDTGLGNFIEFTSRGYQTIQDVIKPLAPKVAPAVKRIGKTIDGFSRRKQ